MSRRKIANGDYPELDVIDGALLILSQPGDAILITDDALEGLIELLEERRSRILEHRRVTRPTTRSTDL